MTSATDFGDRLRQARKAKGLSLEGLAELVGIARQNIAAYEAGKKSPELKRLPLISRALGYPIGWFFGEHAAPEDTRLERVERDLQLVLSKLDKLLERAS